MRFVLLGLAVLFAFGPVLWNACCATGIPPGTTWYFVAAHVIFGTLILTCCYTGRRQLAKMSASLVVAATAVLAALSAGIFLLYPLCLSRCLVHPTAPQWADFGPVYFPLWLQGEIAAAVDAEQSRVAVVNRYGPRSIEQQLTRMPSFDTLQTLTTLLLLFLYQLGVSGLTAFFGLISFRRFGKIALSRPSRFASALPADGTQETWVDFRITPHGDKTLVEPQAMAAPRRW